MPLNTPRTLAVLGVLGTGLLAPAAALAADNTAPSRALPVQIATPFSGSEANGKPDLWRLESGAQANDRVQMAIDNTQGSQSLSVCLLANVDDFGYDAEVDDACDDDDTNKVTVAAGRSARLTAIYTRTPGAILLRASSLYDRVNNYTITIEQITPAPPPVPPPAEPAPAPAAAPAPASAPAATPSTTDYPAIIERTRAATFNRRSVRLPYSVDEPGYEVHRLFLGGRLVDSYRGDTKAGRFTVRLDLDGRARAFVRRAFRRGRSVRFVWKVMVRDEGGNITNEAFDLRFSR